MYPLTLISPAEGREDIRNLCIIIALSNLDKRGQLAMLFALLLDYRDKPDNDNRVTG